MKSALLLSGQMRTWESCYDSLKKYILDPFSPDVFIHTWDTLGSSSISNRGEVGLGDVPLDVAHVKNILKPMEMLVEHFEPRFFDVMDGVSKPRELWCTYHENKGMLPSFYSNLKVKEMKVRVEDQFSFKYDIVFRCRPDLLYLSGIPGHIMDMYKNDPDTLFVPHWNPHRSYALNDVFAFSSSRTIDTYCNLWDMLQNYWDNYQYSIMCETERVLFDYISKFDIEVSRYVPNLMILRYNADRISILSRMMVNNIVPYAVRSYWQRIKPYDNPMPFNMVEVETQTTCNRKCAYCPVHDYPRKKSKMTSSLFKKIVDDLGDIGFDRTFSLMRYNEPLLDKRLPNFVSYAKAVLPECYMKIFTNGDYLTPELFYKLVESGVDTFIVTNHWIEKDGGFVLPENRIYGLLKELKPLDKQHIEVKEYKSGSLMNNRGGLVSILIDTRFNGCNPYDTPGNPMLEVNTLGDVLLCCRQYKDVPCFGNVRDSHVMDIWNSKNFVDTRRMLSEGNLPFDICKRCRHGRWMG